MYLVNLKSFTFKSADDWFAYNDKFGAGNLKEVVF